MTFYLGDRVMVRPTTGNLYIPDPDHDGTVLTVNTEVSWSAYWEALLAQGKILASSLSAAPPLPPVVVPVFTGQALDAAATAFTSIPGAIWGQFLSTISDPSSGDGKFTAAYLYPLAPPNGRLWGMLNDYLTGASEAVGPGLSPTEADAALKAIWVSAAAISP